MTVLVTGAAGYIGSVTVELLLASGESVVAIDNLSTGHRNVVPAKVPFYQGDVGDDALVERVVDRHGVNACVHFAGLSLVSESIKRPSLYFAGNTGQTLILLETLQRSGVHNFIFSSSAAVYGEPNTVPIPEEHPRQPTNPYGHSKLLVEEALARQAALSALRYVALRYFNAAGATNTRGEMHDPETHLIPNVLRAAAGEIEHISVFGVDYDTPDGTAIRDYVHVTDLAEGHLLALDYLRRGGESREMNLGTELGFSVTEVIETAEMVTGARISRVIAPRRQGDPTRLVADASLASRLLGWAPTASSLNEIIVSAWRWHRRHPISYENVDG